MKARKKLPKHVKLKNVTIRVREDFWLKWKLRAASEDITMGEYAEDAISSKMKRKRK